MSSPDNDAARTTRPPRRRQEDRSAAMRLQLMVATVACLIEFGYARTTTVEVCRRAGVTRGALLHHFHDLPDLFAATLEHLYARLLARSVIRPDGELRGEDLVADLWAHFSRPEYKAVIELWLASRNEPHLGEALQPAILRIRDIADPRVNPGLARRLAASPGGAALYRVILEAMIGMALGRAVSPGGGLGHEDEVVALLGHLANETLNL